MNATHCVCPVCVPHPVCPALHGDITAGQGTNSVCPALCVPSVCPGENPGHTETAGQTPNSVCPVRVPCVSQPPGACVSPPIRGHTQRGATTTTPWFTPTQINWHTPNPNHPATQAYKRSTPCPLCGAPAGATCATRQGRPYDTGHGIRNRIASGTCCRGFGTECAGKACGHFLEVLAHG